MRTRLIACGLLVSVSLAGCVTAPAQDSGDVQVFSDIELNGPMPQAFRELVQGVDPYAALYVTETGGGGGRIGRQPSLEAAKSGALAQCVGNNPNRTCILYATKTP